MFKSLILLALFFFLPGISANSEPAIDVFASAKEITLEETVTLNLVIEWAKAEANYAFLLPDFSPKNITVERQGESQETFIRDGAEWIRKTFLIELKPVATGTGVLESFRLGYIDPASQKGGSYTVPEQKFLIKKPPFRFPVIPMPILIAVAAACLLAGLGIVLKMRSKAKKTLLSQAPSPLARYEEAISKVGPEAGKEALRVWAFQLERAVGEIYGIVPGHLTENEMAQAMAKKEIPREEIEKIFALLNRLHEAKFSGGGLATQDLKQLQNEIIDFIQGKQVV